MPIQDNTSTIGYKRQVAKRFDRAAMTYDEYGLFQQEVLQSLFNLIPEQYFSSALDVGTGTGQAIGVLSQRAQTLTALDLSSRMIEQARAEFSFESNVNYVCADMEKLPFPNKVTSLVFSSLALQWCLSLNDVFSELYRVLDDKGFLVFATLSQGSMPEIQEAWQGVDEQSHIHHYVSHDNLLKAVCLAGFDIREQRLDTVTMWFNSPEKAIHSLTKVGASLVGKRGDSALAPGKWRRFLQQYAKQKSQQGVPLSYQVSFVVAYKS
ncbi:malonyl-ACP O-methyltransferase BioC [Marinomonas epiphytica]